MKKFKIKFFLPVTLVFLLIALPYLIDLKFVGTYIEKTVKKDYNLDIRIQETHWYWFPKPGIFLQGTTLLDNAFISDVKIIAVYPDFLSLLTGKVEIDAVELISPEINIKSLKLLSEKFPRDTEKPGTLFPEFRLSISDGILSLPFEGQLAVLKNQIQPLTLIIDEMEVVSQPNIIGIESTFESPFAVKTTTKIHLSRRSPDTPFGDYIWETQSYAKKPEYSQIKKTCLLMFGDNDDVHDVFDNILKSDIQEIRLTFKGTADDFSNMKNIVATAAVENTEMIVPDTNLLLTNGKGSLKIENAVLYGDNLTATLKNSFGKNGNFSPGLAEDDFSFKLNVDIDADLTQLKETVDEFVEAPVLRQEFDKISELTGRTPINLKLGEDLKDLNTYLFLPSLSGSFYYDRLKRDIIVKDGVLDIVPGSITWSNLSFMMGENRFSDISGSLNFQKKPFLNLTNGLAIVDAKDIYQLSGLFPEINKKIKEKISSINGKITFSEIEVKGPPLDMDHLSYKTKLHFEELKLASALIPSPATFSCKSLEISNKTIQAEPLNVDFYDTSIAATVNYKHNSLENLTGSIILNGVAGRKLKSWLKKTGWFPESLFPNLPCSLSPVSVLQGHDGLSITANIIHNNTINTLIEMTDKTTTGLKGSVEILSKKDNAVLEFEAPKTKKTSGIKLSFKGTVGQDLVMNIIDDAWFPAENLNGQFDLFYPLKQNTPIRMNGKVKIKNAKINLNKNGAFLVESLHLDGKNDFADLTTSDLIIIPPDNLKGMIKKKLVLANWSSRLYFQYNEAALLRFLSGNICGLDIRGDLNIPSQKLDFDVTLDGQNGITFDDVFSCLGLTDMSISGDVSVTSKVIGTPANLTGTRFYLKSTKGVIKKATILAKILSLIDLTELFKKNPVKRLISTGYHYDDLEIDAVVSGQKLTITRVKIIGSGVNLYGTGTIDLETHDIDMIILASPFKAIDNIIKNIPIIGKKISGREKSLLSVPIKVEGKFDSPKTRILPQAVSTVSSGVIDIFVETFKLPFKLTHKIITKKSIKDKQPDNTD